MYKIVIGGISTECSSYSPLFQNNIDFKRIEGDKLIKHIDFDFKKYNVRISLVSPGFIKTALTDKNTFNMPFIKSPEYAADKMYNGLIKSSAFEITFPKALTTFLKLLRILLS